MVQCEDQKENPMFYDILAIVVLISAAAYFITGSVVNIIQYIMI